MTFSNMGVVQIPDGMKTKVDQISIMASTAKTSPRALTSVSALDKTTFTFARKLVDTSVEKEFSISLRAKVWTLPCEVTIGRNNDVL